MCEHARNVNERAFAYRLAILRSGLTLVTAFLNSDGHLSFLTRDQGSSYEFTLMEGGHLSVTRLSSVDRKVVREYNGIIQSNRLHQLREDLEALENEQHPATA